MRLSRIHAQQPRQRRAFTLVEMVCIVLILAVLVAVLTPRLDTTFILQKEVDMLQSHLRFAQLRSLSQEYDYWGVRINSGSWVLYKNQSRTLEELPGETSATHTCPSGMTLALGGATGRYLNFTNWGEPCNNSITASATDLALTVTYKGVTKTITVTAMTGCLK